MNGAMKGFKFYFFGVWWSLDRMILTGAKVLFELDVGNLFHICSYVI
jgi:hypothetical protein